MKQTVRYYKGQTNFAAASFAGFDEEKAAARFICQRDFVQTGWQQAELAGRQFYGDAAAGHDHRFFQYGHDSETWLPK